MALGIHELIDSKTNHVFPSHARFGNASNQINMCHLLLVLEVIYKLLLLYIDYEKMFVSMGLHSDWKKKKEMVMIRRRRRN